MSNAFEAELSAFLHLSTILGERKQGARCITCVDSKNVTEMFDIVKSNMYETREGFDKIKLITTYYPNISIQYVNRRWNKEADSFAKQGSNRIKILEGWC